MKIRSKWLFKILAVLVCLLPVSQVFSLQNHDFQINLQGGVSLSRGYFAPYFDPGYKAGISVMFPFPEIPVVIEAGGDYSSLPMKALTASNLASYSVYAGPVFYLPLSHFFHPYLGLLYHGSLLQFNSSINATSSTAYKSGALIRAGVFIPFDNGMGIRVGADYLMTEMSGKSFEDISFKGGVTFNIDQYRRNSLSAPNDEIFSLLEKGKAQYNANLLPLARESFQKVLKVDKENMEAIKYLAKIEARENLKLANEKIKENKFAEAIPLLMDASESLPEANDTLSSLRNRLKFKLPAMEKEGISAFENHKYDSCIQIMNDILLIDPDNKTATIYLPRAIKRKQAFKSLE